MKGTTETICIILLALGLIGTCKVVRYKTKQMLRSDCLVEKLSVYGILKKEGDLFKILEFGNQSYCRNDNHDAYYQDIGALEHFINASKEGAKQ